MFCEKWSRISGMKIKDSSQSNNTKSTFTCDICLCIMTHDMPMACVRMADIRNRNNTLDPSCSSSMQGKSLIVHEPP